MGGAPAEPRIAGGPERGGLHRRNVTCGHFVPPFVWDCAIQGSRGSRLRSRPARPAVGEPVTVPSAVPYTTPVDVNGFSRSFTRLGWLCKWWAVLVSLPVSDIRGRGCGRVGALIGGVHLARRLGARDRFSPAGASLLWDA